MDLTSRAQRLVDQLSVAQQTFGSMTVAVYDTAWVCMIMKPTASGRRWLYPQCFEFILDQQKPEGAWESYAADVDGILNTAASLLACKIHEDHPLQMRTPPMHRTSNAIARGQQALQRQLDRWDVSATVHVGFEYLVPSLLQQLADRGMEFQFPGRASLMALMQSKMGKFSPAFLYSDHKSTALHSLEAFVGKIDFDRMKHHKHSGSFMASPSSTAAYLMNVSQWDDEAEAYLDFVLANGAGNRSGGVPSAFPSTYFEATWALTTLFKNGFTSQDLGAQRILALTALLNDALDQNGGVLGFAPSIQADVDDTAKGLTSLSCMGVEYPTCAMLANFEGDSHFRTYPGERDPSFSANCNALVALTSQSDLTDLAASVEKTAKFLCNAWWETDGWIKDKWNLSHYYSTMLMTEALSGLLEAWESQRLLGIQPGFIRDRVVVCLFQAMARTLLTQNDDGSWGTSGSQEETAYGVLILSKAARLPNLGSLRARIIHSLKVGQDFIISKQARGPSLLWVEKVTYGSEVLTEAYVLAALKASVDPSPSFGRVQSLLQIPHVKVEKFVHFYSKLPLFGNAPKWELALSLVEGYLFLPQIYDQRLDIFPRAGMDEDKYFEYIPFTWTSNNNLNRTFSSANVLQQMMVVSFLNYQADEYMEAVVGRHFRGRKESAMRLVDSILEGDASDPTTNGKDGSRQTLAGQGLATPEASSSDEESFGGFKGSGPPVAGSVREVLSRFIKFVLRHPKVESNTGLMQRTLKAELRRFLEAHLEQCDDNERFATQSEQEAAEKIFRRPRTSFHRWVQTTSSDHTSCPYSFMFFRCLISLDGKDCFPSTAQRYVADALCRHLAVMCRMYNDYGSVARDWDEMNLNSVNFAEFHGSDGQPDMDGAKASLFALATYERQCLDSSMRQLRQLAAAHGAQERVLEKVQMFCNVTDLYGQIYEARDIASRM